MNNDGTISQLEMEKLVDDMKVLLGVRILCCTIRNSFVHKSINLHTFFKDVYIHVILGVRILCTICNSSVQKNKNLHTFSKMYVIFEVRIPSTICNCTKMHVLFQDEGTEVSSKEMLAKSTFTEMDKNGDGKVKQQIYIKFNK